MTRQKTPFSIGLTIGALGVVFGDIGTSPLYALQVTLGSHPVTPNLILGILSLIFWSLTLLISIKYLTLIFRADNEGEGGILALLALLKQKNTRFEPIFCLIAIFGAGLLLGDGMLTPAISVTSAVEGLKTLSPTFEKFVLPLTLIILCGIFIMQSRGTAKIGSIFGPLILIWFVTIGSLGLWQIFDNPVVLKAINPYYAWHFLYLAGWREYFILGSIFLVVTGGEALYADIGHFGKNPIRYGWFFIVFPALILNYFGQGAYLLTNPSLTGNAFFLMAPGWFAIPLMLLATCATVIASQAVISATFSLTKQAVLLGICPRFQIIPTSEEHLGQIYVPQINFILFFGTVLLVLAFKTSDQLAHAYGIAVNCEMLLISTMVAYAAAKVWHWPALKILLLFSPFFVIDFAFLFANLHKFMTGGWVPVIFALLISSLMYAWSSSLTYLKDHFYLKQAQFFKLVRQLDYKSFNHLKGVTSVFITNLYDETGGGFLQFTKLSLAVPEHILIVSYVVDNRPRVRSKRFEVHPLSKTVCRLVLHYGFMDTISIPSALKRAIAENILPFPLALDTITYVVDVPNIVAPIKRKNFFLKLRQRIFSFLMRNYSANWNMEFYNLPFTRTIILGSYCIL